MQNNSLPEKQTAEPIEVEDNVNGNICDSEAATENEKAKAKDRYHFNFLL